jgi:hypothetical protein
MYKNFLKAIRFTISIAVYAWSRSYKHINTYIVETFCDKPKKEALRSSFYHVLANFSLSFYPFPFQNR